VSANSWVGTCALRTEKWDLVGAKGRKRLVATTATLARSVTGSAEDCSDGARAWTARPEVGPFQ